MSTQERSKGGGTGVVDHATARTAAGTAAAPAPVSSVPAKGHCRCCCCCCYRDCLLLLLLLMLMLLLLLLSSSWWPVLRVRKVAAAPRNAAEQQRLLQCPSALQSSRRPAPAANRRCGRPLPAMHCLQAADATAHLRLWCIAPPVHNRHGDVEAEAQQASCACETHAPALVLAVVALAVACDVQ